MKVVGLEATNLYDWKGRYATVWCHWTYFTLVLTAKGIAGDDEDVLV